MKATRWLPVHLLLFGLLALSPRLAAGGSVTDDEGEISPVLANLNARLAASGSNVRVAKASFLAAPNSNVAGKTIFADDRAKALDTHWMYADPRRGGRTNITYLVDLSDGTANPGLSPSETEAAIDRAMQTWSRAQCGNVEIVKVADPGTDPDIADGLFGYGDIGTPLAADIVHGGWLPAGFFDALFPGGGTSFLGITMSFFFIDAPSGSDVDHDGKLDTAFRETYYNNGFTWAIDGDMPPADVESVALHEAGHGLSHEHFGKVFMTNSNEQMHVAPYAVMNAILTQQAHELEASDMGRHCSIWGNWRH